MIPTQESPEPTQTSTVTSGPKSHKLIIIILAVILLSAVGAAIYYMTRPEPTTPAPAAVQSGSAALSVTPASETVQKGKTFTVTVWADTQDQSANAVQANLTYPADKLDFQSVDGSESTYEIQADSNGGGGTVTIARGQVGGVIGKHIVAKINFVAKVDTGTSEIKFADTSSIIRSTDNSNILGQTTGGNYIMEASTE